MNLCGCIEEAVSYLIVMHYAMLSTFWTNHNSL